MARDYKRMDAAAVERAQIHKAVMRSVWATAGTLGAVATPIFSGVDPAALFGLGLIPAVAYANSSLTLSRKFFLQQEKRKESARRGGKPVLGAPPQRDCFEKALSAAREKGKTMIDRYMVGFDLYTGEPLWVGDDDLCSHACVFAKTGVGKTLWLESLMFQQMARGRASGCTFIDAKRDSGTLAQIILMALVTGRIEDLIVVDPFEPAHSYNFVMTGQRADVKARKVLRAGLPPTSDASTTKHYDRLAGDSIQRMVRSFESFGLSWSIHDMAVALSQFNLAYPHLRNMLYKIGARQAMVELGHLAASYRTARGSLDTARITDNLRGIASELHSISGSEMGKIFCTRYTDLVLTDAIARGKIIYFMLPRLEDAENAARMVKLFREDLEVSIGEITSARNVHLEDPHLTIIDEGSSTFGPTWANLFELARKGRFALIFGAQSTGGLTDSAMGLSEAFYERVMANVNLKVMMRIGDNRTAEDMANWFGKVSTTKKSIGAGVTSGRMSNAAGSFDLAARRSGGESQSINISEDEEDLVSAEELKHEMSAEKGLAWFDLGDGRIVKGRALWFNAELPDNWEGREFLTRLDRFEDDEIGLGDWVDEQVLSQERKETSPQYAPKTRQQYAPEEARQKQEAARPKEESVKKEAAPEKQPETNGPFKLGPGNVAGGVNRHRRGVVTSVEAPKVEPQEEEKQSNKAAQEQGWRVTPRGRGSKKKGKK